MSARGAEPRQGASTAAWCAVGGAAIAGVSAGHRSQRRRGQSGLLVVRRAKAASEPRLQDGDVVAVVGAGGNVGRLVVQRLCEEGRHRVRAVLRDPDAARSSWAEGLDGLELFAADTRDYAALAAALSGAHSVVCTTGVPAFGFSGQWKDGNHPESVDHFGVKNAVHAWMSGASSTPKRRFVLMSSIGVTRRDGFPYLVLNGGGVLDAKARGEAAVLALAEEAGFATTIVRPGQLFGGPYGNNRYLGTLFKLDKDATTQAVQLVSGDTAVGDTLRSALAGVLVRCLFAQGKALDFAVVNEEGPAPVEADVDAMLQSLAGVEGGDGAADEQLEKRAALSADTFGKAFSNLLGGKPFGGDE